MSNKETTVKKPRKPRTKKLTVIKNKPALVNPEDMIMKAMNKGMTIDILERLLDLKDRVERSAAEKLFREAMTKFQAKCPIIPKTKIVKNKPEKGGGIRYKFTPIDQIEKVIKPIREECQLSHIFKTEIVDKPDFGIMETIIISHIAGHSESTSFYAPIDPEAYMTAPQKWLSATTFAKRIVLCNGYGITTGDEDNDANDLDDEEKQKADKIQKEKDKKLDALPQNIKDGFKALGYGRKAAFAVCEEQSWDNKKIKERINYIADNANSGKLF